MSGQNPTPEQEKVWKKLKVGSGNVRCPRCQKDLGCKYEDIGLMFKDGGSRGCVHCGLSFHRCVAGRFGFHSVLGCKRCNRAPMTEKRRKKKTMKLRIRHFAEQARHSKKVGDKLLTLVRQTLAEYYEDRSNEFKQECIEVADAIVAKLEK